ncbi:hypothetical protein QOZ80_3BG0284870 [Eleusine coracana subsp. coracana]|nr:hypothetical protein QOZ80_3BG0284870 [Eleusine coracana subsp. coracana]
MWNCSAPPSLLLPFGDDYVKCESSSSQAGAVGLDRMLPADYDLCHTLDLSQSLHSFQTPMLFPMHGSHSYFGGSSIYNGEASQTFAHQFDCTQPTTATSVKWTAARETMTGDDSNLIRGSSKRLKTTTVATAQGPHRGLRCNAKPRNNQLVKAPSKRSQKLGDKITALQQLVSPYGKTDTASVLHEAATCIKHLHQQIQILTTSYPDISSLTSQQDIVGKVEEGTTDLGRRGLCLAPLSPAVVELASRGHRDMTNTVDCWRQLGTL